MSTFKPSHEGIGELLRSDFIQAEMVRRGQLVKDEAEATAPDAPPYGVGYKYKFRLMWGIKTSKKGTRRAFARIVNDADYAIFVEKGGRNTPAHHTMIRALNAAKG